MKIHVLTAREWEKLKKIPDEMKSGKFVYSLPENLNELGTWIEQ